MFDKTIGKGGYSEWTAREGTGLNRFTKAGETSSEVLLTPAPTAITEAGTPFNVDAMNNIDDTLVQLSNLNIITDIATIPTSGTGVYYASSATGAPVSGYVMYEYKGEAAAGVLIAKPLSANVGQVWERRRYGSAWTTKWMLVSGLTTMSVDTEYIVSTDNAGTSIYAIKRTFTISNGLYGQVVNVPAWTTILDVALAVNSRSSPNASNWYSANAYVSPMVMIQRESSTGTDSGIITVWYTK